MTYLDKYNEYVNFMESGGMKNYNNAMKIFLDKNPSQICPNCQKSGIIKNVLADGKIEMKCKDTKCGWNMTIIPAKTINLYNELSNKNKDTIELLFKLITDRDNFKKNKEEYLKSKKQLDEIKNVFKKQTETEDKIEKEKFDLSDNMMVLYYQRKNVFKEITNKINSKKTRYMLDLYKNEKEISDNRISQLSKQLDLPKDDIKNFLKWLNISKQYIDIQLKLNKVSEEIEEQKNIMKDISNNFMTTLPIITENKKITVTKGTTQTIEKVDKEDNDKEEEDEDSEIDEETDDEKEMEEEPEIDEETDDETNDEKEIEEEQKTDEETDDEEKDEEIKVEEETDDEKEEDNDLSDSDIADKDIKIVKIKKEDMIPKEEDEEPEVKKIKIKVKKKLPIIIPTSGEKQVKLKKDI